MSIIDIKLIYKNKHKGEKMIVALATNDKETIIKDHFGDAKYFSLYNVFDSEAEFIGLVENTARLQEGSHKEKAIYILDILNTNNVNVLVNRSFGTNLKIIVKYLLPVIIRKNLIIEALEIFKINYNKILNVYVSKKSCYALVTEENEVKVVETK